MRRSEFKNRPAGNAAKLKVGIVVARFHDDITSAMQKGAEKTLREWKVTPKNIHVAHVAGSFEVPLAASRLIRKHKLNAVVAIGCIIKGETKHDEYLAHAVTDGLMRVSLDMGVPVGLGVLTVNTLAQAKARSSGGSDHGASAAAAALEAALV
ncbi:6,7-dimethyl-8-ribityllumazine synthase [Candidatus Parcubacteria bacterium]|nr:MAG: 6,7-dimethyl-8-ribityllumazine synthase [Candidatus Parcubacteria bacterium]